VAIAQHGRHLVGGFGQHHDHRQLLVGGKPVGFVRPHCALGGNHTLARHDGAQIGDDLRAAGEHRLIGCGHDDGHERSKAAFKR